MTERLTLTRPLDQSHTEKTSRRSVIDSVLSTITYRSVNTPEFDGGEMKEVWLGLGLGLGLLSTYACPSLTQTNAAISGLQQHRRTHVKDLGRTRRPLCALTGGAGMSKARTALWRGTMFLQHVHMQRRTAAPSLFKYRHTQTDRHTHLPFSPPPTYHSSYVHTHTQSPSPVQPQPSVVYSTLTCCNLTTNHHFTPTCWSSAAFSGRQRIRAFFSSALSLCHRSPTKIHCSLRRCHR